MGEARPSSRLGEAAPPPWTRSDTGPGLLGAVLARENLLRALKQVRANQGAAGVDGLDIDQTVNMLRTDWPAIRESLLKGTYRPQPVRRVMIPKPGGGERELGIPTVLDRLIQQALLQVLQPILDPTFSRHSYGFRPGRSAHEAVLAAQSYVQSGRRIVVDVDLEKFFDRVDHDILIDRLRRTLTGRGDGAAALLHTGMEGLLPVSANTWSLACAGQMVASPLAGGSAQAMEARQDDLPGTDSSGSEHQCGTAGGG